MLSKKINSARQLTVPGSHGRSIVVKKGQYVVVRDIEGGQCGDFWGNRLVRQPFNLFMNTFVESDGTLLIRNPISKSGDKITMIARMSLIILVSACPTDLNPVGGQGITDLEIIVADTKEELMLF